MSAATTEVRDGRPPLALVRVLNPVNRVLLRTPAGRLIGAFALLEFSGRRSGRPFRVPVGWHDDGQTPIVFSPAPWRANFAGGRDAVVRHRGRTQRLVGTLVTDPSEVAGALNAVIARGVAPGMVGIKAPAGHALTADDVRLLDRQAIRFHA